MEYIKGIIVFILIVNVISEFIPGDSYRKYLKHISGIMLILMVTKPLNIFLNTENIEDKFNKIILEDNILEADEFMHNIDSESEKNMIYLYENGIASEVMNYLENCNFDVNDVSADIVITENNEIELKKLEIDMKFINHNTENEYIKNLIAEKFSISGDRIEIK